MWHIMITGFGNMSSLGCACVVTTILELMITEPMFDNNWMASFNPIQSLKLEKRNKKQEFQHFSKKVFSPKSIPRSAIQLWQRNLTGVWSGSCYCQRRFMIWVSLFIHYFPFSNYEFYFQSILITDFYFRALICFEETFDISFEAFCFMAFEVISNRAYYKIFRSFV